MTGGGRPVPAWRRVTIYVVAAVALVLVLGMGLIVGPLVWFAALTWLYGDRETGRIPGPDGLEIVILDTSNSATIGSSYVLGVASSGIAADRDGAVALVAGPREVRAAWQGRSVAICASGARIFHDQNLYDIRVGGSLAEGEVSLHPLDDCPALGG